MEPIITVVICTYNRLNHLKKAVDSLINQTIDNSMYEILIVDNNSTDGTANIADKYYPKIGNIRYILETRQSVAIARNTGWQHSNTKYVAYLDDDEIAKSDWLEQMLITIDSTKELNIGAIGGKVEPMWEIPRPEWLSDPLTAILSIIDISDTPRVITQKEPIITGNVIYPKKALEQAGGFDINISKRQGYNLVNLVGDESYKENEETILHKSLENNGYLLYYSPKIIIYHHIPKERLTKKWFIRRYFWAGYSHTYIYIKENEQSSKSALIYKARLLLIHLYQSLLNSALAVLSLFTKRNSHYLVYICRLCRSFGYIYGLIKIR